MTGITTRTEDQLVITAVTSQVSFDDIAEFIMTNVDSRTGELTIWDLSEMDFNIVSSDDLSVFLERVASASAKRAGERVAFVAPSDLQFGMMRAFEMLAELTGYTPIRFSVFRTVAEAKDWLLNRGV